MLGEKDPEQSLVVADEFPKLITGCGHYGISEIATVAKALIGREIVSVIGGFHLLNRSKAVIDREITQLRAIGVKRAFPTHCTGELALQLFERAFGGDSVGEIK